MDVQKVLLLRCEMMTNSQSFFALAFINTRLPTFQLKIETVSELCIVAVHMNQILSRLFHQLFFHIYTPIERKRGDIGWLSFLFLLKSLSVNQEFTVTDCDQQTKINNQQ